jgi:hypothetical protein
MKERSGASWDERPRRDIMMGEERRNEMLCEQSKGQLYEIQCAGCYIPFIIVTSS